jgi:hypothetical protein
MTDSLWRGGLFQISSSHDLLDVVPPPPPVNNLRLVFLPCFAFCLASGKEEFSLLHHHFPSSIFHHNVKDNQIVIMSINVGINGFGRIGR